MAEISPWEHWANVIRLQKTVKENLQEEIEYLEAKLEWIIANCCQGPSENYVLDNNDNTVIDNDGNSVIV